MQNNSRGCFGRKGKALSNGIGSKSSRFFAADRFEAGVCLLDRHPLFPQSYPHSKWLFYLFPLTFPHYPQGLFDLSTLSTLFLKLMHSFSEIFKNLSTKTKKQASFLLYIEIPIKTALYILKKGNSLFLITCFL